MHLLLTGWLAELKSGLISSDGGVMRVSNNSFKNDQGFHF